MGIRLESEHASDDDLELYFLKSLPNPQLDRIEQHLLVCTLCASRQPNSSATTFPLCDWPSVVTPPPKDHAPMPNQSVSLPEHSHSNSGMFLCRRCCERALRAVGPVCGEAQP
jgi:hypothetical protein